MSTNNIIKDNCRGCTSLVKILGGAITCIYDEYADECPCSNCIVKVMCRESCAIHDQFREDKGFSTYIGVP